MLIATDTRGVSIRPQKKENNDKLLGAVLLFDTKNASC